jgi:acyl-coenzyme A thioesterase PaaI-like protein
MIDLDVIRAGLAGERTPTSEAELREDGWEIMPDTGFLGYVGPIWIKDHPDHFRAGFLAEDKHRNRRGVVQGGMIMTFADRALAMAGRKVNFDGPQATLQMDTHFISPGHLGEFIECFSTVTRKTKTLMFITGIVCHEERVIATVSGLWKMLRRE